MQIKIKPQIAESSCGFSVIGRPYSSDEVIRRVSKFEQYLYKSNIGIYVYWKEKHRAKWIDKEVTTCTGKVKVTKEIIPTHWRYKIWFIPDALVKLLSADGKVIKQYKQHWSIESKGSTP